jgi:hypothetical protein
MSPESVQHLGEAHPESAALVEQSYLDGRDGRDVTQPLSAVDVRESTSRRLAEAVRIREVPDEGVGVSDDRRHVL